MTSFLRLSFLNVAFFAGLMCNPLLKLEPKNSTTDVVSSVKFLDSFESQLFEKLKTEPNSVPHFSLWQDFKKNYGKKHSTLEEEQKRFLIFVKNHHEIQHHNLRHKLGLTSFSMGLNQFADLEATEFKKIFNGYKSKSKFSIFPKTNSTVFVATEGIELPKFIDWRNKGYVTPVKDQRQCGSCWAFSATGSLEGQHFRKNNKLVSLSEQNLIDCSTPEGNNGCHGGLMDMAFQYVMDNGGLDTEKAYPYEAMDDKCRFKNSSIGTTEKSYENIESENETDLAAALTSVGPISVAIDASHMSFQFYESGVYYEPKCSSEDLDHGVLAVGYGQTKKGKKYWIVKNSWGEWWGTKGYIKMAKDRDNNCGIATEASYPII